MHYFLLPMVPLTIAGALFFKRRIAAYGFPIMLTLIKMVMTQPAPVYFFTAVALLAVVFLTRKIHENSAFSWVRLLITSIIGVFTYEIVSTFGMWMIGGCTGDERLYALNFSGLLASYQGALHYASFHLLKAVPSTLLLVFALSQLKRLNVAFDLQRLTSTKTSL